MQNEVQVDQNGNWTYQVPTDLEPGTYTITLRGTDLNGNPIEKPYTFTVQGNASVNNPLPDAAISSNQFMSIIGLLLIFCVAIFILKRRSFEEKILNNKKI